MFALNQLQVDLQGTNTLERRSANAYGHSPYNFSKPKIGVSGAAETGSCGLDAFEMAKAIGREIVRQGGMIVTAATTGFPLYSAIGAKEEGGFSLGFSPAASEREHIERYKLPLEYMDVCVYTGFGYSGRDLFFVRAVDAMIFGCGRIGTINEFTVAFEDQKPIAILEGDGWETDAVLQHILKAGNRASDKVVFEKDPHLLIEKIMKLIARDQQEVYKIYQNHDGVKEEGKALL